MIQLQPLNVFKINLLAYFLGCFLFPCNLLAQDDQKLVNESTEKKENVEDQEENSEEQTREDRQRWRFGDFRLRLGAAKPRFSDGEIYEALYGAPKIHMFLGGDYYFWQKYFAIGVGFKTAYYVAQGFAGRSSVPVASTTAETITKDDTEPTELIYIPVQANINLQFTPFPKKYLTIDGWVGYERGYLQEVRGKSAKTGSADTEVKKGAKTNKTLINSAVVGVALNISLSPLDESSSNSMRSSLKLSNIYLSPFIEYVRPMGDVKGFDFKRTNLGLAFTFEGI